MRSIALHLTLRFVIANRLVKLSVLAVGTFGWKTREVKFREQAECQHQGVAAKISLIR